MTKEDLKEKLDSPDIVIIDVRVGGSWTGSEVKIKNAVREDPQNADAWMKKYAKDKTLILYCAWKNEATSARVAQKLIDNGFAKSYALKGGWNEWSKAKFPTEHK